MRTLAVEVELDRNCDVGQISRHLLGLRRGDNLTPRLEVRGVSQQGCRVPWLHEGDCGRCFGRGRAARVTQIGEAQVVLYVLQGGGGDTCTVPPVKS